MSVIVMGAELPKGYDDCWYLQCDSWKDCYKNGMRNDCPLRPLPEKHGRLIDADELEDVFYRFHSQSAGYVQEAETIVEAEGE